MVKQTLEELRVNPEQPFWVYNQVGQELVQQNKLVEASMLYQQAIQQHPNNSEPYRFLGTIQEKLRDIPGQIASYRQAIALDSNQPFWVYTTLGHLLCQQGNFTEALGLYREALQRDPDRANANIYVQLGDVLAQVGESDECIAAYDRALELQPDRDWIRYRIDAQRFIQGMKALQNNEIAVAIAQFQQIDRVQNLDRISIPWFAENGVNWPHSSFAWREDLEKLKPPELDWVKITVVTPSFNQEKYIEETLLSVLNQNYPNLEYIVVDGESTDESQSILERYRERLSLLIIEPDSGQSEAINKGFRRATGELLIWINSDDMLAPGALHLAALTYLKHRCDLVAGICLVHHDRQIMAMRTPKVRQADFTVECLSDVARKWSSGHFFFQPEVFFSRRIWEKAGSQLNESLYYAMDHELWLRFAAQGATLEVIGYPIALFRKHEEQKTANQTASVQELLQVTSAYGSVQLENGRSQEISQKISRLIHSSARRVLILTQRSDQIAERYLAFWDLNGERSYQFWVSDTAKNLDITDFDAIILMVHLKNELETIKIIQSYKFSGLLIGWFWENQFRYDFNIEVAEQVDIAIPTQGFIAGVLRNSWSWLTPAVPRGSIQWKKEEFQSLFQRDKNIDRSSCLDGKFSNYAWAHRRNQLVEQVRKILPDSHLNWIENARDYFTLSSEERFHQWIRYKVSLCLPIQQELPCRVFDALLCGLIPLVPADVLDLDAVIPPNLQVELPIIRFQEYTAESVVAAYKEALARFDTEGDSGIQRRHNFVVEKHMWINRVKSIIGFLSSSDASSTQPISEQPKNIEDIKLDSPDRTPIWLYFERGQDLEKQGKLTEAIALYQEAAQVYSENADVFRALGIVQDKLGQVDGVVDNYCRAIKLDPQQPIWVYLTLCRFLTEQEKFEDSIKLHQAALKLYPEHPELYRSLGITHEKQGNFAGTIEYYRRTIEVEPKQPAWVYLTLGRLLREAEQLEESLAVHEAALQFHSNNANVYCSLGVTQVKLGDEEGVIQNYRHALELNSQQPIWVYLTLGRLLRERNFLEEALAVHLSAVEQYPDNSEAYGALAFAQQKSGEIESATANYRQAIALNPESPLWLHLALGELVLQQEQIAEAVDFYQDLQQKYPTNPAIYQSLGRAQEKHEDITGAISSYQQAIALESDRQVWVYMTLGQLLREQERFDEAISVYQSAAQIFPENADLYRALGTVYSQTDAVDAAISSYQQAIALESDRQVWVYMTLGQLLREQERFDEAISVYQSAAQIFPENADVYRGLGTVQNEMNHPEAAIESYRQAIAIEPNGPVWVYLTLGQLVNDRNHLTEAILLYQEALKLYPENADLYRMLGTAQKQNNDRSDAILSYQQAIALQPENSAWVYLTLGQLLKEEERLDESISIYDEAAKIFPDFAEVYRTMATLQNQMHQLEAATVSYRQALSLDPNSPVWVYMTLGQLLEEQEDLDGALELYEEASERYPDQPDFYRALGLVQKKKEMSKLKLPPTNGVLP